MKLKSVFTALLFLFGNSLFADSVSFSRDKLSPVMAPPAENIKIDGDLSEWSFTNSQVIFVAEEFFANERAEFAFSYDQDALYLAAKVHDTSPMKNVHHMSGRFWEGDSIQLRLYSKLNARHVPARQRDVVSQDKQLVHANLYYQHPAGKTWIRLDYSINFIESKIDPPGAEGAYKLFPNGNGYTVEFKLPWSLLNMETGPKPGDDIRALVEVNFSDYLGQKRVRRTSGAYNENPGDFGFLGGNKWGQVKFTAKPVAKRMYPTAKQIAATITKDAGLVIPVRFPFKACATLNIKDATGKLVREIVLSEEQPAGPYEFVWDGKDNTGADATLGNYTYETLFYKPVKAVYKGSTASSGNPVYGTIDGTGEWGGDHSNPLAVSIDATGTTLLWPIAELGKAIVRLDKNDKVLWRYTPFFDSAGNFYTMASDGEYVYLTYETAKVSPKIFRLNAADGSPAFFAKDTKAIDLPVDGTERKAVDSRDRATAFDLIASGMAVDERFIYVALYPRNEVLVLNKQDATLVKRISVPAPRGLACGLRNEIYAVSFPAPGKGAVYKLSSKGDATKIIGGGLSAPWNVAVKKGGNLVVTDLGESQQVKEFSPDGQLVTIYGQKGGRATSGAYESGDYLKPSGIAADSSGNMIVVESAIPSVISRLNKRGKVKKQWFGPANYAHSVWPDAEDPYRIYSMLPGGILRSRLKPFWKNWQPETYWSFTSSRAKREAKQGKTGHGLTYDYFKDRYFQNFTGAISYPQTTMLEGHQYMSSDSQEHPIVRVEGSELIPVATCFAQDGKVFVGHDTNHNGIIDDTEIERLKNIPAIADTNPHKLLNQHTGSHTLSGTSGNWYIAGGRTIYRIPLKSATDGQLIFDSEKAGIFIKDVTDGYKGSFHPTHRSAILGMREDSHGNLYVLYTYGGRSPGIGHSSDIKRVFVVKFDHDGNRLWSAGRKASSFAQPGEVYNPWIMAGLLNDTLVAFSDETGGMIHFYDANGFYRGKIFADYARGDAQPGPYLFHGENFSGRVQYFPKRKQYMAYQGMTDSRAFELRNVEAKTQRDSGALVLSQHYSKDQAKQVSNVSVATIAKPLSLDGDHAGWQKLAPLKISTAADLRLAVSKQELFFQFEVKDTSPMMNAEADPTMAFKGGDAVDLYFGTTGKRANDKPVLGDVRILVSPYQGAVRVTGMKVKSSGQKKPVTYTNPGGYKRDFDYVGAIVGARAVAVKTKAGYRIRGAVPLSFLQPLSFKAGSSLRFDADILQSDASGRRTLNRIFWHASGNSALTMTQDIPTECYLYPTYWGEAKVK
jgi:hypothetical protein